MSNDRLSDAEKQALRSFDLFCSGGRPQRPTQDSSSPELVEVSGEELFAAFLKKHPTFADCKRDILARLPARVRIHADWWADNR